MNKRKFTLFAGLCAATLASGFSNAALAGKLEDILQRGKLIVGTGV
jgi:ABC-type amino acid transport substrate-binding protein